MQRSCRLGGPQVLSSKLIGAREVGVWSTLIVSVAFWANIVRASPGHAPSLHDAIANVLDNGAVDVLAWIWVFVRAGEMYAAKPASRLQIWATFLAGAIVLAPLRLATGLALIILGVCLLRERQALQAARHVGLVFLALAFETVWASSLMQPLHVLVGSMDANISALLLRLLGTDAIVHANTVDNISANFTICIWPACTSSSPLAAVSLLFIVVALLRGESPRRSHLPWLGGSLIASILLTEVRLVLLAMNESSYNWWHTGPGLTIYTMVALVPAVIFPILATSDHKMAGALPLNRLVA